MDSDSAAKKLPKDSDEIDEVEVILQVSPDSKEINLKFINPDAFTVNSFIMELETYLHEISQAADQMEKPGVNKH